MLYRLVRTIVSVGLGLFYRIEVVRRVDDFTGPVMFVGNHPNSLIDPAMVFVITERRVTFLAREPLFRIPGLGWLLKGIGALPVFRKQDQPGLMERNEGTLDAAAAALTAGCAITIFPEGKSHSDPQLSDLKTGCARIALKTARGGRALRIIPIGLTYAQKHQFQSQVHVEVGEPLLVEAVTGLKGDAEQQWVRDLTQRVGDALKSVTLNLETWEDLDLVHTADRLFALRNGFRVDDPERLRRFAQGAATLRSLDADRFDDLKEDVLSFRRRLDLVRAEPGDLGVQLEWRQVLWFAVRNLCALFLGLPLFLLGLVLFCIPFVLVRGLSLAAPVSEDRTATLKFTAALVIVPAWWLLLTLAGWSVAGGPGLVVALLGALPLALFTRYFLLRRHAAFSDVLAFFRLGSRSTLRAHLVSEGERLSDEIQRTVDEVMPKLGAGRRPGP